jgi:RNA polymerase sigma-70 factor (ECF subfamily)
VEAGANDREQALIRALREGRHECVGELVDLHGEGLMRYLMSILGDRDSAEDVFQDTWVRVIRRIAGFRGDRPFAPWLFRIARNRAYDHLRWRRLRGLVRGRDDAADGAEPEIPTEDAFADRLASRDSAARVLAALSPRLREVLCLRFLHELSYQEIAGVCGVPVGTVKSRLARALERAAEARRALEA